MLLVSNYFSFLDIFVPYFVEKQRNKYLIFVIKAYDIVMNTNLHLGPLVCLLIELYYNNFTFPKRHLWVLALYGTGYLMINLGNF